MVSNGKDYVNKNIQIVNVYYDELNKYKVILNYSIYFVNKLDCSTCRYSICVFTVIA